MTPEYAEALAALARSALEVLDNLTTEEFSKGGDRPARQALVELLDLLGFATEHERAEYGLRSR